ncbi:MAG: hypothetical protein CME85_02535 [Henriciella sp.]|jgi:hypothetical protein|nr:TIGR03982 family His-Xaa-Ser system protein [Henriciella sp.]MAO81279.1 hypothetical protein [Nocardioides sp.]MBK74355.1 hypothetical protein [Henriciella sp.]|tara:strand:- start:922 stop:1317 length:396 start_codon:yes stop_codon:yes gene_type:complete
MRWAFKQNRLLFVGAFLLGVAAGVLALPAWRWSIIQLNQTKYSELTYRCDSAMRAHYQAKAQLQSEAEPSDVERLRQTELGLIDCQDYDILQKNLLILGLRESELGLMRLKAIEADADGLLDVVDAHEIRD